MATFVPFFGAQLEGPEGSVETEVALAEKVAIGIYFASNASEAAKEFNGKLTSAYNEVLKAKGFEVVLVSLDAEEGDYDALFGELPCCALPFSSTDEKQALVEKYGVTEGPTMIIVDEAGATMQEDGIGKVTDDPVGEKFPWFELPETEILIRMGPVPPDAGEDGLKGIFIRNGNFQELGLVDQTERDENITFSGFNPKPYVFLDKAGRQKEIQKMGVMSDWQPYAKDIE